MDVNSLRVVKDVDMTRWFVGVDVCAILGYRKAPDAIKKHVDERHKKAYGSLVLRNAHFPKLQNTTILITDVGLQTLLAGSRLPFKDDVCAWFQRNYGIETTIISRLFKEQESVAHLQVALGVIKSVYQFRIGPYRIDLYIPKYRLAIECDEFDHKGYRQEKEDERHQYITDELRCTFYRYNPDAEDFSIFHVIAEIYKYVMSFTQ